MRDMTQLIAALVVGAALGTVFYRGLWWTVRHGLTAPNPAVWFGISALTRMAVLLAGLYYFARGGWLSLVMCLFGVMLARVATLRFARVKH